MKEFKAVLFVNDYKKADNQPDYKGHLEYEGEKIKIAGWNSKNGAISIRSEKEFEGTRRTINGITGKPIETDLPF